MAAPMLISCPRTCLSRPARLFAGSLKRQKEYGLRDEEIAAPPAQRPPAAAATSNVFLRRKDARAATPPRSARERQAAPFATPIRC